MPPILPAMFLLNVRNPRSKSTTILVCYVVKFFVKMLNGFRILLLIVVLIGIVLISGYTQLMFGKDSEKTSSTINGPLSYSVPMITKTQPSQNVYSRQKTEKDQNTEESVQKTGYTDVAKILETNQNTEEDRKLPSMKNRTAEARNDNIVIFNRVPKTGSEMFQAFTKHLGKLFFK